MQADSTPVRSDLVLIGGGHSHLFVLKYFAMNPVPGVRLTLIARDVHTPYSGMLPGYIAGHYAYDEAHIDLRPLAVYAGARLIHAEVNAIDTEQQLISFPHRPSIAYDVLSINIGSIPGMPASAQGDDRQFAVKPINRFLDRWSDLEQRILAAQKPCKLAIVGAGAGGVELALSLQYRIKQALAAARNPGQQLKLSLVTEDDQILSSFNIKVQQRFRRLLKKHNIETLCNTRVERFEAGRLYGVNGDSLECDAVIWVSSASAPGWLRNTGLELDEGGFIAVNDCLQSLSHPQVFAAGDIASVDAFPRPKSGVFAVRQGIPLAQNLVRTLRNRPIKSFKPQKQFLSLISTGERYAVASKAGWSFEGAWLWHLKNWIDKRFMRQFSELPEMPEALPDESVGDKIEVPSMRCGGCGSKIGSKVLAQVLSRLEVGVTEGVVMGLDAPDDAAVIEVPAGRQLVQSVDFFRSFIDDPFLFGKIATNHALSDLFAMGAEPHSAMAIASIPFASEIKQEQELFQLMSGAVECLKENNTVLIGGHSSEAHELGFGLSVNGFAEDGQLLLKSGMQIGDCLLLTKPLGTGVLFAADMRRKAKGRWIDTALEHMLISNRDAAHCLRRHGASACTDVTGFGLVGHLYEMTRASALAVEIDPRQLPILEGALELVEQGIFSSLQPQNMRIKHAIEDTDNMARLTQYALLFDPQTAGGLLATLPADKVEACVDELRCGGYGQAIIIGRVVEPFDATRNIRLARAVT
jgi:selenide,water dikinase